MTEPTIETPVSSRDNDWWRRAFRTLVQIVAGGGLAWLTDQLATDLPAQYVPYMMGAYTVLVALAQNAAEDAGKIPSLLKGKSSDGQ